IDSNNIDNTVKEKGLELEKKIREIEEKSIKKGVFGFGLIKQKEKKQRDLELLKMENDKLEKLKKSREK
ncbi:MAG: hypothetical protein ACD_82C00188G0001, partial [uncultured bacterium]